MTKRGLQPFAAACLAGLAIMAFVAEPAAAQNTIGELAPGSIPSAFCENGPTEGASTGSAAASYSVPTGGVITSWSTKAAEGSGQQLTFKVYRPLGDAEYLVVGHDGPRTLRPGVLNTFATDIPVQAGDVIGIDDVEASAAPTACAWETGDPSDTMWYAEGDATDGATVTALGEEGGIRFNETATLLAPPTVSSIWPGSVSDDGGAITIIGSEYADVESVTVGSSPVSFAVASETAITISAPAGTAGTSVPVTVTTAAGSATYELDYEATMGATASAGTAGETTTTPTCKVPRLKGRTLKAAKKALRGADCRVGKVKRKKDVTSRSGKVVGQNPRQGTVRAAGAKVSIRLG